MTGCGGLFLAINAARFFCTRVPKQTSYIPGAKKMSVYLEKLGLLMPPKRPPSAYILFAKSILPTYRKDYPDLKLTQLSTKIGEAWHKLHQSEKDKFQEEFAKRKEQYIEEVDKIENSVKPKMKLKIEAAVKHYEAQKKKTEAKKILESLGMPKRPLSAFFLFAQDQLVMRPEKQSIKTFMVTLGTQWKSLQPETKKQYLERASHLREEHRHQMQKWRDVITAGEANEIFPDAKQQKNEK